MFIFIFYDYLDTIIMRFRYANIKLHGLMLVTRLFKYFHFRQAHRDSHKSNGNYYQKLEVNKIMSVVLAAEWQVSLQLSVTLIGIDNYIFRVVTN